MQDMNEQLKDIKSLLFGEEAVEELEAEVELQKHIEKSMERVSAQEIQVKSKRDIFSQFISYDNSYEIMKMVKSFSEVNALNVNTFKENLKNLCLDIVYKGQSPVEMLIYSTKAFYNNKFAQNAVIDILKDLNFIDKKFKAAYHNIFKNWNWVEQISIVIKSCETINMEEMGEDIMEIAEGSECLRQEAISALVNMKLKQYFGRIVNLMSAAREDSKEIANIAAEVYPKMARDSEGEEALFKAYFNNKNFALNSIFIAALKNNISSEDLNKLIEYSQGNDLAKQKKALYLLGKVNNRYGVQAIKTLLDSNSVDQKELFTIIGFSKNAEFIPPLRDCIKDTSKNTDLRYKSLISLGNFNDKNQIPFIKEFLSEGDEVRIAASSALLQLGEINYLVDLFKYVLKEENNDFAKLAKNQLKRIRGLRNQELNFKIDSACEKILEGDKENICLNIIDILTRANSDRSSSIILNKLNNTNLIEPKRKILQYFAENYVQFDPNFQEQVRNSIVKLSRDKTSKVVMMESMKALEIINKRTDFAPVKGA
jgi:HEAT repeat protein